MYEPAPVYIERNCVPTLQTSSQDYHQWMFSDDDYAWSSLWTPDVTDAGSGWTGYIHSWTSQNAFTNVSSTNDLKVYSTLSYWGTGVYGATSPGRNYIWLSVENWAYSPPFAQMVSMHEFGHALGYAHKGISCVNETIMALVNPDAGIYPRGFGSADNTAMNRDIH